MDGFIIVNKEKGYTSHDVCFKIKKLLNGAKIGHTGTLDPNTTGVLVVGVNKALKLMQLLNEHDKTYVTTVMFGISTDTYDITGKVVESRDVKDITTKQIEEALKELEKQKTQIPPIYSSIKVEGKKLYEYAREGKSIELMPRDIKIYSIKRLSDLYEIDSKLCLDIELSVGKGYYVRSFINDLSKILGIPATMYELQRNICGDFNITEAYTLKDIEENNYKIKSIEEVFPTLEHLEVNDYMARLVLNGVMLDERQIITDRPFIVYNQNKLIAVYEVVGENKYKPLLINK